MVDWSQADVFRLIESYREQRLLWDPLVEDYKNRNKKHDAWVMLDETLSVEAGECERKMRKLIGQFTRESKKVSKTGKGAIDDRKWVYYKHLLFLRDKNLPRGSEDVGIVRKTESEVVEAAYDQDSMQVAEDNEDLDGPLEENTGTPQNTGTPENTGTLENTETPENTGTSTTSTHGPRKHISSILRPIRNKKTREDEAYAVMKGLMNKEKDSYEIYGAHVAATLRNLDKVSGTYAKFEINKIIFNAERGMYASQSERSTPNSKSSTADSCTTQTQYVEISHPSTSFTVTEQHPPYAQHEDNDMQSNENDGNNLVAFINL